MGDSNAARVKKWAESEGSPSPLGVSWIVSEQAYNFALHSEHAESVELLLYTEDDVATPVATFAFDHLVNKSGRIWHMRVPLAEAKGAEYYGYRVDGPAPQGRFAWHQFDPEKILLDPYAKEVHFPEDYDREASARPGSNAGKAPLGVLIERRPQHERRGHRKPHHESDLVIYEMHVRGFTKHGSSGLAESLRGTFLGVIEKIPHLKDLGVTAVELMPVHQFDPDEGNFWGYMTLNFFAPHQQYASHEDHAQDEFWEMIQALHEADIEVILDVVYNHTSESDHRGPTYSYKGIDNATYYLSTGDPRDPYMNFSGTGNTLHCANRTVRRLILDSLRHWVTEMRIDGFRFDLASVLARGSDGSVDLDDPPVITAIRTMPEMRDVRLIAEPWDAAGLYQLGRSFAGTTWLQWNGQYRDDVRRFVRGDKGMVAPMMRRIYGSDDLFPDSRIDAFHPYQSVNYICSHDGFTLCDQVSYNERHNAANGEENRDGHRDNHSWNCGHEGEEGVTDEVMALRKQQIKNHITLLMLSNGTPMFLSGDEFMNTQGGNNNPYNQDNETTWIDWSRKDDHPDIFRYFKRIIAFRKAHPSLSRSRFWREDVTWHGTGEHPDLSEASHSLAFHLRGDSEGDRDLYVMINSFWEALDFEVQAGEKEEWRRVVDTALPSPNDIAELGTGEPLMSMHMRLAPRSIVVLERTVGS